MEPESGLEVNDRRRVHLEEEPAQPMAAPETPAGIIEDAIPAGPETPAGIIEDAIPAGPETPADIIEDAIPAAPADEDTAEEPLNMDVYTLLQSTIGILCSGAWGWLGLSPSPFTGKMDRDLAQARIAIDVVVFMARTLDDRLNDAERNEIQNVLSMLRMNYVQQTQK